MHLTERNLKALEAAFVLAGALHASVNPKGGAHRRMCERLADRGLLTADPHRLTDAGLLALDEHRRRP